MCFSYLNIEKLQLLDFVKFFESNNVQMYNVSGFNQSKGFLFDKNHDLDDILEIQSGLE